MRGAISISDKIDTPLYPHQRDAVYKMYEVERGKREIDDWIYLHSKVGFMADKVGTGKTLEILAAVTSLPDPAPQSAFLSGYRNLMFESNVSICTVEHQRTSGFTSSVNVDVVFVPHSLLWQWLREIKKHTKMKAFVLNKAWLNNHDNDWVEELGRQELIICKNTMATQFCERCMIRNIQFRRVFYDEADTIALPSRCPILDARFHWFVTATPAQLMQAQIRLTRMTVVSRMMQMVPWSALEETSFEDMVMVRSPATRVGESITYQVPVEQTYYCAPPRTMMALDGVISAEAMMKLEADDVQGALNHTENVLDTTHALNVVKEQIEKSRAFVEANLETARQHGVLVNVYHLMTQLEALDAKLKTIENNLLELGDCPICCTEITEDDPVGIFRCCRGKVCFSCYATIGTGLRPGGDYGYVPPKCPFCRGPLTKENMLVMKKDWKKTPESADASTSSGPMTKLGVLENLLRDIANTPDGRALVFTETWGTFTSAFTRTLERAGVRYASLKGGSSEVDHKIKRFENGKLDVLLMNSRFMGAGLNLQCASDVVFYHQPSTEDLRTQVVGRANRPGRTTQLTVHTLTYRNSHAL